MRALLARVYELMGDLDRARRILEEALEGFRRHEDAWTAAHILNHLAVVPLRRGEYQRAAELAEEALALTRETGDRLAAQTALQILAQSAWMMGEAEEATRRFRASLTVARELADRVNVAYCMQGLAETDLARGAPLRLVRSRDAPEGDGRRPGGTGRTGVEGSAGRGTNDDLRRGGDAHARGRPDAVPVQPPRETDPAPRETPVAAV